MIPRATFAFSDNRYGWSETLYYAAIAADLYVVRDAATVLGLLRKEMLGGSAQVDEIRVSDDLVFRDSLVTGLSPNYSSVYGNPADLGNLPDQAVQPFYSLLVRMEAGPLYRKSIYLSGLPFGIITNPWPGAVFSSVWGPLYRAWLDEILSGRWGFKAHVQPDSGMGTPKSVFLTNITIPDNETIVISWSGVQPLDNVGPGDRVRIRGVRVAFGQKPRISGSYVVKSPVAGHSVVLFAHGHLQQANAIVNPGVAWIDQVTIQPIVTANQQGFTEHKRGRPFAEPRGRRGRT